MLRVLMVYDAVFPDYVGGVEQRNLSLALALARRGHHATLAGWFDDMPEASMNVEYRRLGPKRNLYDARGRRRAAAAFVLAADVWKQLDLAQFDVIETANLPYLQVLALSLKARRARRPLLVTWHEYWGRYWQEYVGGYRWPAYAAIEWIVARAASRRIAVSHLTARRLEQATRSAVPVVPNGVDLTAVRDAVTSVGEPGPPLIYVGRLLREKRVDVLLEATRLLGSELAEPTTLLTVAGEGPEEQRLRALSERLGIAHRVRFAGRLRDNARVWRELGGARLAVQPSSREGFGMFPLEAMAAGLPVVYCHSSESAVRDLVRDGVEGFAVHPEPAEIARVVGRLLSDSQCWGSLHNAALERSKAFSWDVVADRFIDQLESAVAR
jgi:glycosyltransferase involved in cell wall biosynthesis